MENLTQTLAEKAIASTYVAPPVKEKKTIKKPKVATTEPLRQVTRQQLRARERERVKMERRMMAQAGRYYDQRMAAE